MNYKKISEDNWEENYVLFLARNVLVVANVNKKLKSEEVAEWSAYIGCAKWKEEWGSIKEHGSKLPKSVADALFPFSKTHRWR